MDNLRRFETIKDYNAFNNNETLHPLVSVVNLSKASPRQASNMYFGFYTVFLKEVICGDLRYGRHTYDYQEGTLVFIAPGQVVSVSNSGETYQPKGHALIFHPDLIHGTVLGRHIQDKAQHSISPRIGNQYRLFRYRKPKQNVLHLG
jgi:hypothetical protein